MTSTIEISFYPLKDDYPAAVLQFLQKLKSIPDIEMHTNGMSTILIGNFDSLWRQLGDLMADEMGPGSSLFVLKVAPGRREYVDQ